MLEWFMMIVWKPSYTNIHFLIKHQSMDDDIPVIWDDKPNTADQQTLQMKAFPDVDLRFVTKNSALTPFNIQNTHLGIRWLSCQWWCNDSCSAISHNPAGKSKFILQCYQANRWSCVFFLSLCEWHSRESLNTFTTVSIISDAFPQKIDKTCVEIGSLEDWKKHFKWCCCDIHVEILESHPSLKEDTWCLSQW